VKKVLSRKKKRCLNTYMKSLCMAGRTGNDVTSRLGKSVPSSRRQHGRLQAYNCIFVVEDNVFHIQENMAVTGVDLKGLIIYAKVLVHDVWIAY
jgi:hypothetical protein